MEHGHRPEVRILRRMGGDRLWATVHLVGRALITLGILMALFVGYQLWGTNLVTAREQRTLKADFAEQLEAQPPASEPAADPPVEVTEGGALALLEIPALGAEYAVVEGVGVRALRKGPGHYPFTPLPGHQGNAAIAGHRTTYGAPFNRLDEVERGDELRVTTLEGRFRYRVIENRVVGRGDVQVLESGDSNLLTLTTCHPEYSSRQRLVVTARLVGEPVDAAPGPEPESPPPPPDRPADAGLDGGHDSGLAGIGPTLALTAVLAIAVGGTWWWAFRRRRRWYIWAAGVPPFAIALFFFFAELERVLPASY
jgi:sortase A